MLTDPESQLRGYGPECWEKISGICLSNIENYQENSVLPGQMSIFDFDEFESGDGNGRE